MAISAHPMNENLSECEGLLVGFYVQAVKYGLDNIPVKESSLKTAKFRAEDDIAFSRAVERLALARIDVMYNCEVNQ